MLQYQPLLFHRVLKDIFPRYLRAPSDSDAKPIEKLYIGEPVYCCAVCAFLQTLEKHDDTLTNHVFFLLR